MSIVIVVTEDHEIVRVFRDRGFGYRREEIHHWEIESAEEEE
jgi:hypothetical protein